MFLLERPGRSSYATYYFTPSNRTEMKICLKIPWRKNLENICDTALVIMYCTVIGRRRYTRAFVTFRTGATKTASVDDPDGNARGRMTACGKRILFEAKANAETKPPKIIQSSSFAFIDFGFFVSQYF